MLNAVAGAVERALADGGGILRLEPCWVARDLVPPGRRLGLSEDAYDAGERGFICERWLASTTPADNRVGPPDEGLSYVALEGWSPVRLTLKAAVEARPREIMGTGYAATHSGLGRLAKVFDYADRLPYHLHLRPQHAALVGRHSKDEAYYFPAGYDMGAHPETFFGVHPWIAETRAYDALLPYLVDWNGDGILRHASGYVQLTDEGFDVPSGILHAPGTALTVELQEDSDVLAIFQAKNAGRIVSKDLLFKDVRREDRERLGERFALELVDWELNGDPYFYEHRHLSPRPVEGSVTEAGRKDWIFYNSRRFSGQRLLVRPGRTYRSVESGVYSLLVLEGSGIVGGHRVRGRAPGEDELLVSHSTATAGVEVANDGSADLVLIEFFGPDINLNVPVISALNPA
jgi:hypothetical protein